jgi:hypothetical protein
MTVLSLQVLDDRLSVVRLPPGSASPPWLPTTGFSSVTRTADELSIVCASASVPPSVTVDGLPVEDGWRLMMLLGPFEFTLTGILLAVLEPLATAGIGIFAISTYDTDYVMVKADGLDAAVTSLREAGHAVTTGDR